MLTAAGNIRREHVAQLDAALLADPCPVGACLPVLADDALLAAPRYGDLTQLARWKMWAMLTHCAATAADERTRAAHRRLSPETGSEVKREAKGRLEAFTLGAVMAIRK